MDRYIYGAFMYTAGVVFGWVRWGVPLRKLRRDVRAALPSIRRALGMEPKP